MANVEQLTTAEQWQEVASDPGRSLVFKHSTTCPISAEAHNHFMRWIPGVPDAELKAYRVHVIEDRPLSMQIADETGIGHQSPQALLMRGGKVLWHGSHWVITEDSLAAALADPQNAASHSTGLLEAKAEHQARLAEAGR